MSHYEGVLRIQDDGRNLLDLVLFVKDCDASLAMTWCIIAGDFSLRRGGKNYTNGNMTTLLCHLR